MSKVAIIKCCSYDRSEVKDSIERGMDILGGVARFVKKGENILLKPNILAPDPPEKCVTTHPSVFRAAGEIFLNAGASVSYGDSPAFGNLNWTAKKAGLAGVAEELHIGLADFKTGKEIIFEKGRQNKKFTIAKGVLDSDGLVSLPKLKAHAFQKYTGAIKNQYGCIPGMLKAEFHVKIPDPYNFARMLVDLNCYLRPRLFIMDGIRCMEGNGPRGGKIIAMNIILLSGDPVALDATVCRLIGLDPEFVPVIHYGMESGLGTYLEKEIELAGDDFNDLRNDAFDIKRYPLKRYGGRGVNKFLNKRLVSKPYINHDKCVKCGVCVDMCPVDPKALSWMEGDKSIPPVYDYGRCIKCYCCQELCPESAISLKAPLLRRVFGSKPEK